MSKGQEIRYGWGEVGNKIDNISPIYQLIPFYDHLFGSVQVARTIVDQNVCIKGEIRPDGYEYYEMLLVYVDDIMVVSHSDGEVARKTGNFNIIK